MVVEFSVEEELRIESQARIPYHCEDKEEVAKLCSSLVRQNAYLSKLVRQATGHISQLELQAVLNGLEEEDPRLVELVRSLSECDGSDPTHPDGTRDQNLFVTLLVIVIAPFAWLAGAFVGLLHLAMQTMNRAIRGLGS